MCTAVNTIHTLPHAHTTLMYHTQMLHSSIYNHLLNVVSVPNSFVTQDSDASPKSNGGNTTPATLGQDLDSLLGSAPSTSAPAAAAPAQQQNSDLGDLNLDDLLGPGANSAPPQRYSGGGRSGVPSPIPAARAPPASTGGQGGWDSPPPMSYSGDFGATSGKYGDSAAAAASKALKGDQQLTLVEVGEDGACPVEEKDVDAQTVTALKARGIENFTPVQVCIYMIHVCVVLFDAFWFILKHIDVVHIYIARKRQIKRGSKRCPSPGRFTAGTFMCVLVFSLCLFSFFLFLSSRSLCVPFFHYCGDSKHCCVWKPYYITV